MAKSVGYKPADFNRIVQIAGTEGTIEDIDENMLFEGLPDYLSILPHE
jgi:hypothetical protein